MKVIYDQETDTLSIILTDGKVAESDEARLYITLPRKAAIMQKRQGE